MVLAVPSKIVVISDGEDVLRAFSETEEFPRQEPLGFCRNTQDDFPHAQATRSSACDPLLFHTSAS